MPINKKIHLKKRFMVLLLSGLIIPRRHHPVLRPLAGRELPLLNHYNRDCRIGLHVFSARILVTVQIREKLPEFC